MSARGVYYDLSVWTLKDLMELIDTKRLSITLADLQKYQSDCEERRGLMAGVNSTPLGYGLAAEAGVSNRPDDAYFAQIVEVLKRAETVCKKTGWSSAGSVIGLINIHMDYNKDECDWSSLASDLRNALGAIISAMWTAQFVKVSPEFASYVNNESLISDQVKKAFPSAVEDVREAGNCIAVDCGTAAVFHLMRAVEWGIRALCVDLGVLSVPRKKATTPIEFAEWDKILDLLNPASAAKVDALSPGPQKQELQEFYFPLLLDIRGFKDAFRNHVMHTRKTYTAKAADDVLDHVRRFFNLLSTKISE